MVPRLKNVAHRLKKLKLWSLEDRRIWTDLVEVFRLLMVSSHYHWTPFFVLDTDSRTRGHPWKLKRGERTQMWDIISFLKELSTGGTNWTAQQFVLRESMTSRIDYKECGWKTSLSLGTSSINSGGWSDFWSGELSLPRLGDRDISPICYCYKCKKLPFYNNV